MNDSSQDSGREVDPRRSRWTEQDVEHLLEGFFREEIPAEIRDLADGDAGPLTHAPVGRRTTARWLISAFAAAAVLVSLAWLTQETLRQADVPLVQEQPQEPSVTDQQPTVAQASALPLLSLTVDRYATDVGVVEQRTAVKWETVSVYQPESGVEVAWSIPEVDIELFGVR